MYMLDAVYRVIKFHDNGTVTLRNIKTSKEITQALVVDLNNGTLKVADGL